MCKGNHLFYSDKWISQQTIPSQKKAVIQGYHLSLYMFVLAMEYLIRLLKSLRTNNKFKFHPRCHKQQIIQLNFVDDFLLISRGMCMSCPPLWMFSAILTSIIIENQTKSCAYFGVVLGKDQQLVLQHTRFTKGKVPFRYLGVPLSSKKLSISQCQTLLDRMLGRINTWKVKFLSYARRLQLVRSVLTSIQPFWAQIFLLQNKLLK